MYEWVMLTSLSLLSLTFQSPALPTASPSQPSSKYLITRSDVHEVLSKLVKTDDTHIALNRVNSI